MMRKLIALLALFVMALPFTMVAQEEAPNNAIVLLGDNLVYGDGTLTIEGVSNILPVSLSGEGGVNTSFLMVSDFVDDWKYGIEKLADLNLTEEAFIMTANIEFEVVIDGTREIFVQTVTLNSPELVDGNLTFAVVEAGEITALFDDKSEAPESAEAFILSVVYGGDFAEAYNAAAVMRANDGRTTSMTTCSPRSACG